MSNLSYRPEIDGLRAVSVIGVVLFHAGLGFTGGYVGVDVFFVISGFLITSIILKNISAGSFSLTDFWIRRIRRILPAVSFMVATVGILGILLLDPVTLKSQSQASIAQSVMLANVHFFRDVGYFSESADYKPLLHMWSLAVEEQFYLVFPFAMMLAYRLFNKNIFPLFLVFAIISFSMNLYATQYHPSAAFFLLQNRAWELLTGALIAIGQNKISFNQRVSEVVSFVGLLMIFAAMLLYDNNTTFPGVYALLPVAGAGAFIAGCKDRPTLAGKFLSIRPIVFIGLISYSLYLWHWPLFVFVNHVLIEVNTGTKLTLVLTSLLLGFLSYKFVEQPLRKKVILSSSSSVLRFGIIVSLVMFLSSCVIYKLDGLPNRFNANLNLISQDVKSPGLELEKKGKATLIGASRLNENNMAPDFVLWGDSHGMVISELLDIKAKEAGLVGEAYLLQGTIPIPGLWRPNWDNLKIEKILERNDQILQSIVERKIPNIILLGRWNVNCSGRNKLEIEKGQSLSGSLVTDTNEVNRQNITPDQASASVNRQLKNMIKKLSESGTNLWIIKQVPETNNMNSAREFLIYKRFPLVNNLERFTIIWDDHIRRNIHSQNAFRGLESSTVKIIYPSPQFFENDERRLEAYSERSYYRDDDHLARYGVEKFFSKIIDDIFTEIQYQK